ncbi:hypothetical protein [Alkalimonas amylolytica]|uniref:Lipoprotein n=1 Tax=Alkalimonas amylolytica TaxID=152573 RepID=A0A1H3XTG9_ALKAM|nr:hypothetical protein [Alkalimonas amylolytica]SEA02520.1 hypothetical protein SAMN04488051_101382 [Alkalimonas amylolytica]
MANRLLITVFILLFMQGCKPTQQQTVFYGQPYVYVSMFELLVHTERFNWRDFIIRGYLADGYLYLSPEQAKHRDTSYAIAIHPDLSSPAINFSDFNEKWVFINGRLLFEYDSKAYAGYSTLVVREISSRD